MDDQRVIVPGSCLEHGAEARWSPAACDERVQVTIYLRRKDEAGRKSSAEELLSGQFQPISREEAAARLTASSEDMEAVRGFAETHGLRVVREDLVSRTIHVEGTVEQLGSVFRVKLGKLEDSSGAHLSYQGTIMIPAALAGVVVAVLGLDQRPVARPHAL